MSKFSTLGQLAAPRQLPKPVRTCVSPRYWPDAGYHAPLLDRDFTFHRISLLWTTVQERAVQAQDIQQGKLERVGPHQRRGGFRFSAFTEVPLGLLQRHPVNHPPPYVGGALGGNSLQRFPPKLPLYMGGVETPLIYKVSSNSPYISNHTVSS